MTHSSGSSLAIIGMGCLFPKSGHLGAYWSLLKNGTDAITDIPSTHWNPSDYFDPNPKAPDMTYVRRGGFLDPYPFSPHDYGIAPNDLEATDTSQLLSLVAAEMALRDAGYGPDREFDRSKVSVILGVTGTLELVIPLGARLGHPHWRRAMQAAGIPDAQIEEAVRRIGESYVAWQENSFPGLLGNVVAGRVANRLNLKGTNCVVDAACASSLSALHLAGLELMAGRCDVVVTGGVDTFNDIFMYMCFSKTPALSPTGDARPFSAQADGTILGEGLGILVLKRLEDAQRDGDRIYAIIRGWGSSSDGKGHAIYAPSAEGQVRCLRAAYEHAGITPDTVELVEAHGTGTKVGDATELQSLTEVYRSARPQSAWCALGSVKSQIGHTKAAAGAAGIIKAALALYHKVLPPTIKVDQPASPLTNNASPFYVNTIKRPWLPREEHPRRAAVSAFGFGGSNFHCVLEEADIRKTVTDWDGSIQIVAIHGDTPDGIAESLRSWVGVDSWAAVSEKAAQSRASFNHLAPCRLTFVLHRHGESSERVVSSARELLQREARSAFALSPLGIYWGRGPTPGKLALLFPGQGSQYVGMLRDWSCTFPEMLDSLTVANRVFAAQASAAQEPRLSDWIYPPPAFDPIVRQQQETELRSTRIAQPAIGAVSLGALQVLRSFGIVGEMAAGHSFGELTALCAAGCYTPHQFLELACFRGQLMGQWQNQHAGGMLAIHAGAEVVQQLLNESQSQLLIANVNSPNQVVVSGLQRDIESLIKRLSDQGIRWTRLSVSAAFHSPLVAPAEAPFRRYLGAMSLAEPALEVYSNSTAQPYPRETAALQTLLAEQLARPVQFVKQIRSMHERGAATFLEVGPGHILTRLVEQIVRDLPAAHSVDAIAIDSSNGKRSGLYDLATALARLAARGHTVRLEEWEKSPAHPVPKLAAISRFTVPICGANYRKTFPNTTIHNSHSTPNGRQEPTTDRPTPAMSEVKHMSEASVNENQQSPVSSKPHEPTVKSPISIMPASHDSVSPQRTVHVSQDSRSPSGRAPLAQALQLTQEGLQVFQRLQEQTAQLHRQFLQHQEAAQQALTRLIEQQQQLIFTTLNGSVPSLLTKAPVSSPTLPASTPAVRNESNHTATTPLRSSAVAVTSPAPAADVVPPATHVATDTPAPQTVTTVDPLVGLSSAPRNGRQTTNPGRVRQVLLEVVSEKTGYPVEMLDPAMGLDSDLGIDSIKRVEILSTLQERLPEAPAIKPEHLGSLNTLEQIVQFLVGRDVESPKTDAPHNGHAPVTRPPSHRRDQVQSILLEVVSDKTGYPVDMLSPTMGLDADLGIDSIKRVEILSALQERLPEAPVIKPEHLGTLNTLQQIIDFLAGEPPPEERQPNAVPPEPVPPTRLVRQTLGSQPLPFDLGRSAPQLPDSGAILVVGGADALADHLTEKVRLLTGRVTRRFWDSPLDVDEPIGGILFVAPRQPSLEILRSAFRWLRHSAQHWAASPHRFALSISRIDGEFGLSGRLADHWPFDAGLSGLIKTAQHEWPDVKCQAVDVDPTLPPEEVAQKIFSIIGDRTPVELGLTARGWRSLQLTESPIGTLDHQLFCQQDVLVITGGARGVTAAVALELARRYQPRLVLLGRTTLSAEEPDWLQSARDEREIKCALAKHHADWSPRQLGKACREILAVREIRANLNRVRETGAIVDYYPVDVRKPSELATIIDHVRQQYGPISGLIHGAGVIEDRRIIDKSDEQFDTVLSTKVVGLVHLIELLNRDPLRAIVLFSSSTGRFGRKGQCDYAAANEVLNKLARWLASRLPQCRVASINWGPWEGGMVTPELGKVFASEGIGLIPLRAGAEFVLKELSAKDGAIESVVMAYPNQPTLSSMAPHRDSPNHDLTDHVWKRSVSVDTHPVLASHVLDGRAVLPFVLHLEWLAHAAMHGHPGMQFVGWENAKILHGVKLNADSELELQAFAGRSERSEGLYRVVSELRSHAASAGRSLIHSRATVTLGTRPAPVVSRLAVVRDAQPLPPIKAPYEWLFHGEHFQAIERILTTTDRGLEAIVRSAPPPSQWCHEPLRTSWVADPLAMDAAFQLVVLWSIHRRGFPVLPTGFRRYQQFQPQFSHAVRVFVEVQSHHERKLIAQIEWLTDSNTLIARLEDGEFVGDPHLASAFRRNQLSRSPAITIS
jgi:acyl transferase domain-containing protein